jgi:hypothetical protein
MRFLPQLLKACSTLLRILGECILLYKQKHINFISYLQGEVDGEKINNMVISREWNGGENQNIKTSNTPFEREENFHTRNNPNKCEFRL